MSAGWLGFVIYTNKQLIVTNFPDSFQTSKGSRQSVAIDTFVSRWVVNFSCWNQPNKEKIGGVELKILLILIINQVLSYYKFNFAHPQDLEEIDFLSGFLSIKKYPAKCQQTDQPIQESLNPKSRLITTRKRNDKTNILNRIEITRLV